MLNQSLLCNNLQINLTKSCSGC